MKPAVKLIKISTQCRYVKDDNNRCSRKTRFGDFCWQHSKITKIGVATLLSTASALICIFTFLKPSIVEKYNEVNLICDRDSELGCKLILHIDSVTTSTRALVGVKNGKPILSKEVNRSISIFSGPVLREQSLSLFNKEYSVGFPTAFSIDDKYLNPEYIKQSGFTIKDDFKPFTLKLKDNILEVEGNIYDIRTGELVGRINKDEFTRMQSCSISWNKDDKAIEIIDRYGNVCFFVEVINNSERGVIEKGIKYKGYFKHKKYYYVFNDEVYKTNDLEEAIELARKIEHTFEHFKENSLGLRL